MKRNRFDAGILVAEPYWPEQDFIQGVVVRCKAFDAHLLDEYQRQPKFRGICYEAATEEIPAVFGELERRGISLELASGLELVPHVAKRFPNLRVAIGQMGPPFDENWPARLERAARHSNVYCKLSGLTRIQPSPRFHVQHALAVFGPGRVMFGSDWPNSLPEYTWKAGLAAFTQAIGPQPIEVREEILGGTAARFYAL